MNSIQIAQIRSATRAEGPGKRLAIWTQGCSIRCHGCFNPHLWELNPDKELSMSESIRVIEEKLTADSEIEGLSFLGGEPFNQPGALAELGYYFRQKELSIVTFTGYTYESLLSQSKENPEIMDLLEVTDLLIDGPFIENRLDEVRPWLGSTNQRYLFLTDRYSMKDVDSNRDVVEVTVSIDGKVYINGWAPHERVVALTSQF